MQSKTSSEAELLKSVLLWLSSERSVLYWRVPLGGVAQKGGRFYSRNPMTGHPDIAGVVAGRYFAIELKRLGKKNNLSPGQRDWTSKLTAHGAVVIIATTLEEVQYGFKEHFGDYLGSPNKLMCA